MGAGVAAVMYLWKKKNAAEATQARAIGLLDTFASQFIHNVVRTQFHPRLLEVNSGVEEALVRTFYQRMHTYLPGDAEQLLERVRSTRSLLTGSA